MTTIAIFGAASAMAEHAARALAGPGVSFFLVARNIVMLERIAADLRARGSASVATAVYDFSDMDGIPALAERAARELGGAIDHALIAFGTLIPTERAEHDRTYMASGMALNYVAPALLSQELTNRMAAAGKGHLAVITSVAGERGRQSNYAYGSAKAGLGVFLQGLRHRLTGRGVEVLNVCPGFVDTPMVRDVPKNFLFAQPEPVGLGIANAMRARRGGKMYVPGFWALIMLIVRHVPTLLFHKTKL